MKDTVNGFALGLTLGAYAFSYGARGWSLWGWREWMVIAVFFVFLYALWRYDNRKEV